VGDALHVGREAHALVKAVNGGALDLQTTADLVRTGYAHVLVNQSEGPWLDGKHSVALQTDKQKLEFAKDVAAFANSPHGGLIVIGAATADTANGDVIRSVRDIDLTTVNVPQMRAIVRERVFPTIEGLDIRAIDHGSDRGVVMVHVPPQPVSRTPFLVGGAVVDGKVKTVYMSLSCATARTRGGRTCRASTHCCRRGASQMPSSTSQALSTASSRTWPPLAAPAPQAGRPSFAKRSRFPCGGDFAVTRWIGCA
jgi:hypothetical protein